MHKLTLDVCKCRPAPLQLLHRSFFSCAPSFPTLAVDLNVLDFCLELFVRSAPNKTAFCSALEAFLKQRGYLLESSVYAFVYSLFYPCLIHPKDSLRRRFSKALHWYWVLRDLARSAVDALVGSTSVDTGADADEGTNLPERSTVPSPTLQSRCPACFGDPDWKHDPSLT